jgi:hypothetical protein
LDFQWEFPRQYTVEDRFGFPATERFYQLTTPPPFAKATGGTPPMEGNFILIAAGRGTPDAVYQFRFAGTFPAIIETCGLSALHLPAHILVGGFIDRHIHIVAALKQNAAIVVRPVIIHVPAAPSGRNIRHRLVILDVGFARAIRLRHKPAVFASEFKAIGARPSRHSIIRRVISSPSRTKVRRHALIVFPQHAAIYTPRAVFRTLSPRLHGISAVAGPIPASVRSVADVRLVPLVHIRRRISRTQVNRLAVPCEIGAPQAYRVRIREILEKYRMIRDGAIGVVIGPKAVHRLVPLHRVKDPLQESVGRVRPEKGHKETQKNKKQYPHLIPFPLRHKRALSSVPPAA